MAEPQCSLEKNAGKNSVRVVGCGGEGWGSVATTATRAENLLMTVTLRDDGPEGGWPGMQRGEAPVEWPPKRRRGPD